MLDRKIDVPETNQPSWWARHRFHMFVLVLAFGATQWALKQLGWLFGWTAEPQQGHLGQVFDAMVILATGVFLMIHAIRHIHRHEEERQAVLDRFHEKAVEAKQAKNLHA